MPRDLSRTMAMECCTLMVAGFNYQKVPTEWKTLATTRAVSRLSNAGGAWFEKKVAFSLLKAGFEGSGRKAAIETAVGRISIPSEIGQLDYLGFCPARKMLVLVEAKMVESAIEGPQLGLFGQPRVNVLALNLALDALQ